MSRLYKTVVVLGVTFFATVGANKPLFSSEFWLESKAASVGDIWKEGFALAFRSVGQFTDFAGRVVGFRNDKFRNRVKRPDGVVSQEMHCRKVPTYNCHQSKACKQQDCGSIHEIQLECEVIATGGSMQVLEILIVDERE